MPASRFTQQEEYCAIRPMSIRLEVVIRFSALTSRRGYNGHFGARPAR